MSRRAAVLLVALVLILTSAVVVVTLMVPSPTPTGAPRIGPAAAKLSDASLHRRFAVLSTRDSNQCGLLPGDLSTMSRHGRLQGACCSAMVFARYAQQVRGLSRHSLRQVPRDPYDISVSQARLLLSFDRNITLSGALRRTYERAVTLSSEHGPCCCHCWRWSAFRGLAKSLIESKHDGPSEVARLWNLENGCGGAGPINDAGS